MMQLFSITTTIIAIRQKKNKSGSASVQIVSKTRGAYKVVKTIGCGTKSHEIDQLLEKAKSEKLKLEKQLPLFSSIQDEVTKRGFTVAHIKTDSIKIPDATPEIVQFCIDFVKPYGYVLEFEGFIEKICLVNGSTYIAKFATQEKCQEMSTINGLYFVMQK